MENQERVLMGWVGFIYVDGGYKSATEYKRLNWIVEGDSTYVSIVSGNKGNALTDKTKWVCIASGAAATAAAKSALEKIEELNLLQAQLSRDLTAIQNASAVTSETAVALASITSKMYEVSQMVETLETLQLGIASAVSAANQAYAMASQIEGVNVMAAKPSGMTLTYSADAPVGVDVRIVPKVFPDTANQSVVFIPLEGAVVTPDGVVKSPAAAGVVKVYVVCTEQSGVWKEVQVTFREASALTQNDGTALTQDDGTTTLEV